MNLKERLSAILNRIEDLQENTSLVNSSELYNELENIQNDILDITEELEKNDNEKSSRRQRQDDGLLY